MPKRVKFGSRDYLDYSPASKIVKIRETNDTIVHNKSTEINQNNTKDSSLTLGRTRNVVNNPNALCEINSGDLIADGKDITVKRGLPTIRVDCIESDGENENLENFAPVSPLSRPESQDIESDRDSFSRHPSDVEIDIEHVEEPDDNRELLTYDQMTEAAKKYGPHLANKLGCTTAYALKLIEQSWYRLNSRKYKKDCRVWLHKNFTTFYSYSEIKRFAAETGGIREKVLTKASYGHTEEGFTPLPSTEEIEARYEKLKEIPQRGCKKDCRTWLHKNSKRIKSQNCEEDSRLKSAENPNVLRSNVNVNRCRDSDNSGHEIGQSDESSPQIKYKATDHPQSTKTLNARQMMRHLGLQHTQSDPEICRGYKGRLRSSRTIAKNTNIQNSPKYVEDLEKESRAVRYPGNDSFELKAPKEDIAEEYCWIEDYNTYCAVSRSSSNITLNGHESSEENLNSNTRNMNHCHSVSPRQSDDSDGDLYDYQS